MTALDAPSRTTVLRVFAETSGDAPLLETTDAGEIARELAAIGVRFERWNAERELPPGATQEQIVEAYRAPVEQLRRECGYEAVDVLRLERGAANAAELRAKFLNEHTHDEDEVRFFVEGCGAFYLHAAQRVYQAVCVRGDLISVPAGTKHWFDMGPRPEFCAIRLFTDAEGWVARFTGDPIADRFPKLDAP
jgi:1,2-dihydroxy-3-keto-5-methylthiopentene dioxygenase